MYANQLRYLAVAFLDAESVRPNQGEIADLIREFPDLQLTAAAVQETTLLGPDRRIVFISQDSSWQIFLLGKRFHVARVPKHPLGGDIGKFSEFCEQSNKILKWAVNRFERRPHRLAGVQEGVLPQKPNEEMDAIARRLLSLPGAFKNSALDEWDWRASTRVGRQVGNRKELLNTIATIKRIQGSVSLSSDADLVSPLVPLPTQFALIRVDIDVNTVQDNTSARFQDAHMDSFFGNVGAWHEELIAEIKGLINEGQ